MKTDYLDEMKVPLRGELRENVNLASYTSWKIGGNADYCYAPADLEDLQNFIAHLVDKKNITWLGLGSNVLIRDGGICGTVILTQGKLKALSKLDELTVRGEAGLSCAQVARYCAKNSLSDVEFLAGVPGTIGGALRMNAGAFGGEIWDHIIAVETLDKQGNMHLRLPEEFTISYRTVEGLRDEWFVAGHFRCRTGNKEESLAKIREFLAKRSETQPINKPNCGSVFRNPPGHFAARLIEESGLKGKCIGQACISEKHANFIINKGGASSNEVEELISLIQCEIKQKKAQELVPEVIILGKSLLDLGKKKKEMN